MEHEHNFILMGGVKEKGELLWQAFKCNCGEWGYKVYNEEKFLKLTVKGCHLMRM